MLYRMVTLSMTLMDPLTELPVICLYTSAQLRSFRSTNSQRHLVADDVAQRTHYLVYSGLASNVDVAQEHNSSGTSAGIACCHVNNRRLLAASVAVRLLGTGLWSLRLPAHKTIN